MVAARRVPHVADVGHVIEAATSGRASCRACRRRIAKGELRFGEREPNPFGNGEATYWFHLLCAAAKVPAAYLEALDALAEPMADAEAHRPLAELAAQHRRVPRLGNVDTAPTGRARCRHCRELIAKGSPRISLEVVTEGLLDAWGFIHARCATPYFETDIVPLLEARDQDLTDELRKELRHG